MVEAVHQQHGVRARGDEPVDYRTEPRDRRRDVVIGVEPGGAEVAVGEIPRAHTAPVGTAPRVERCELVDLGAVAAPVDERIESEPGEQLRELRGMPERVGYVGNA